MEKQYYAILSKFTELNGEFMDMEPESLLSPVETHDNAVRIVFKSPDYSKAYNHFQQIKKDYSNVINEIEKSTGQPAETDLVLSIVRISVMKDWETLSR